MKKIIPLCIGLFIAFNMHGQSIINPGDGIGPLHIGQTYQQVTSILGFNGKLKTYDDYVADELFNIDPKKSLECAIGFDYYVKYEYLLTMPVSYVFFKDNKVNQIRVTSIPEYYVSLARDVRTTDGLEFWADPQRVYTVYGKPDFTFNYDAFILKSDFYFSKGITISIRDDYYRVAHIYSPMSNDMVKKFESNLK